MGYKKLAFSYISRYRKQAMALFLGIMVSSALLMGLGSLFYSGRIADRERIRELYGDAHYRLNMDSGNLEDYEKHLEGKGYRVEKAGMLCVKKTMESPFLISFVYADENYREMFGRDFLKGSYPEKPGEAAMSEDTIRNLELSDQIGDMVEIGGGKFVLSGIVKEQWEETEKGMQVFVSEDTDYGENARFLYLKFDEGFGKVLPQMEKFADAFSYPENKIFRVSNLTAYVGGDRVSVISTVKSGLSLPEGKFNFIWGSLNEEWNLTEKLVLCLGCLFSAFVVYSIFQVSVRKRRSEYSIMQTLGMEESGTFRLLFTELMLTLLAAYPAGAVLGNAIAGLLYFYCGGIFVDQSIGAVKAGVHAAGRREIAESVEVNSGAFHLSYHTIAAGFLFLSILFFIAAHVLVKSMKKFTLMEMIKNTGKRKKSRKIVSFSRENMAGVLIKRFMLERKRAAFFMVISMSLGGMMFLGTDYVIRNAKINNELTLKADDGLGSDIQVYEESDCLSDVIPENSVENMKKIKGISAVNPVSYLLGELPLKNGIFTATEFYPEIANIEGWEQEERIMEKYHGIAVREGKDFYRLKVNVYGYSDEMLKELKDYLLEGEISPDKLRKENSVILKALMDGQGNYDMIAVKPGDTITLKVPLSHAPEEALKFEGKEEWYQEKEFEVAAVVSRSLGKTKQYLSEEDTEIAGIIMTNGQMKENFGVEGFHTVSISLKEGSGAGSAAERVKSCVSGIPHCIVKDCTQLIGTQNQYLRQKQGFLYGIALLILLISVFHIFNSMQYVILSKKREFGMIRAMGITDSGFLKMIAGYGIGYGIVCAAFLILCYFLAVRKLLYHVMVHIFLYLHPNAMLPASVFFWTAAVYVLIPVMAVLWAGREILKEEIISEIGK